MIKIWRDVGVPSRLLERLLQRLLHVRWLLSLLVLIHHVVAVVRRIWLVRIRLWVVRLLHILLLHVLLLHVLLLHVRLLIQPFVQPSPTLLC